MKARESIKRAKKKVKGYGRDGVLFVCGIVGVFHETVLNKGERPTLLFIFASMIGLPAFLRSDERRRSAEDRQLPPMRDEKDD